MKYFKNQLKFKVMKHNQKNSYIILLVPLLVIFKCSEKKKVPGLLTKKKTLKKINLNSSIVCENYFLYIQPSFSLLFCL